MAPQVFYGSCRQFATSSCFFKKLPNNLKGRGKSSQEWLIRQMNDPYVKKAKIENYRARSAYKLLEMSERVPQLMSPGDVVVECGAAPGAWSQVALRAVNADGQDAELPVGHVLGVDLVSVRPLPPAVHLQGDFTSAETQQRLEALLPGAPRAVLSDMAPSASGVRALDQRRILALGYEVARFGLRHLADGGALLFKLWAGGGEPELRRRLEPFFERVAVMKPAASRGDSAELYVVATGFRGASQAGGAGQGGGQDAGSASGAGQGGGQDAGSASGAGQGGGQDAGSAGGAGQGAAQDAGSASGAGQGGGQDVGSAGGGVGRLIESDRSGQRAVTVGRDAAVTEEARDGLGRCD